MPKTKPKPDKPILSPDPAGGGVALVPVTTNGVSVLTEAIRLHDRGYWVVPCDGKKPLVNDWPNKRLELVELRNALSNPALNIAIVLNQSELIDVECDSEAAEAALSQMFKGAVPLTPTYRSSRGLHRIFRRPPDMPDKAKVDLDGVEFRGLSTSAGALSVVPPSVHPDGPHYQWLPGLSIHDQVPLSLPDAVAARLRAKEAPKPEAEGGEQEIPEGKRNEELFKKACQLRAMGLKDAVLLTLLLEINRRLCKPPLPDDEVGGIAKSVEKGERKGGAFVNRLLEELELWHDENDEPYATLTQAGHKENWKIGSRARGFRRWISKRHYDMTGLTLKSSDLSEIASTLEGKAVFDGQRFLAHRRTAAHDGRFYLDLCDKDWRAVEIDADGWRVVSEPPVKFCRANAMRALPDPVPTDKPLYDLLKRYLNIRKALWPLVAAWLAAAIRPVGPYAMLKLLGEQGTGKTTVAKLLRDLTDPNASPARGEPRSERDLMISAKNSWLICLDNLSYLQPWLSDALCRLSTGGGLATRTLYTDEDETIFDARRPQLLTGIDDPGIRSDLFDRSVLIDLDTIADVDRKAEEEFKTLFAAAHPAILGALLNVVSGAIRKLPTVQKKADKKLSRMADFEQWGEACEEALGLLAGTFAEAYRANREAATQTILEASALIVELLKWLKQCPGDKEKTATDILEILEAQDQSNKKKKGWPKDARVLSSILKRVAPNLRQIGIVAVQDHKGRDDDKRKVWKITNPNKKAAPTTKPAQPDPEPQAAAPKKPAPKPKSKSRPATERLKNIVVPPTGGA